jgi:hypothetical protein
MTVKLGHIGQSSVGTAFLSLHACRQAYVRIQGFEPLACKIGTFLVYSDPHKVFCYRFELYKQQQRRILAQDFDENMQNRLTAK